jgi:hypothetical protein
MRDSIHGAPPHCLGDRYTKLPDALLSVLSPREHQLVHLLLSYRWKPDSPIYPFVGSMAKRLGWSVRTVQRTLRRLEAKGYLVTTPDFRATDKGQTANRYAPGPLLLPLLAPVDVDPGAPADQPGRPPVTAPTHKRKEQKQTTKDRKGTGLKGYQDRRCRRCQGHGRHCDRCSACLPGPHADGACYRR